MVITNKIDIFFLGLIGVIAVLLFQLFFNMNIYFTFCCIVCLFVGIILGKKSMEKNGKKC